MEFIVIATGVFIIALLCIFMLAMKCKPIRKTIGLLMVIFGILGLLTIWLAVPGIVLVIVGGILLFV